MSRDLKNQSIESKKKSEKTLYYEDVIDTNTEKCKNTSPSPTRFYEY